MDPAPPTYVSRGGIKLEAALRAFNLDVTALTCADLGCNAGGFTDCLLQHGASRVYAVDTGYGALAWKLRQDKRVVVMERTNAVHFDPGGIEGFTGCGLVVIDLGWTRQAHALPAARRWLRIGDLGFGPGAPGWDLKNAQPGMPGESLLGAPATGDLGRALGPPSTTGKSQIPNPKSQIPLIVSLIKPHYEADRALLHHGILDPGDAERVTRRVLDDMPTRGMRVLGHIRSPILGGAGKGKAGNVEYLALLTPA